MTALRRLTRVAGPVEGSFTKMRKMERNQVLPLSLKNQRSLSCFFGICMAGFFYRPTPTLCMTQGKSEWSPTYHMSKNF